MTFSHAKLLGMTFLRLLLVMILMSLALPAYAGLVWRPGEGWVNESGDVMNASSAKAQLEVARDLESKEMYKDAMQAYRSLLRRWPLSIYSGEAQFKVGLMNERVGEFWPAYKAYQLVVSKYPGSQFFDLAVERQYAIGLLYLNGEPQKVWKIPLLPSMEKAVEVFNSVIKAAPYGKYAAQSYFQIGQAREKDKKWAEAIAAYNTILDKYPNNELADSAQYQIGYAWLSASSQPDYDQSAAQKSIEAFEDFLTRYPNSEKIAQAKTHIISLKTRITQGSFNIAAFYEKQKNYKAAFIYYNEVVRLNPDSDQARISKERIEVLRPLVEGGGDAKGNPPQLEAKTNPPQSVN